MSDMKKDVVNLAWDGFHMNLYIFPSEHFSQVALDVCNNHNLWPGHKKFFHKIFKSEFLILAILQNQKLWNKKTQKNISEVSKFSICHFFILFFYFFINLFPGPFFYICSFSSTLYKYRLFVSLTKYEFICLCFDLQNTFTRESIKGNGKMKR